LSPVTLTVSLRDSGGTPLDAPGIVKLRGGLVYTDQVATTKDASAATFQNVGQGEYDAEAQCVGYVNTTEHISVSATGSMMQVYIYLPRESEVKSDTPKPQGMVMSPKLQVEIDKGLDALRRHQFALAHDHFSKGVQMAPGNPNVIYLLGLAEVGLNHPDLALQDFQHALSLDPHYQRALLALGELQLSQGDAASAATTLERAFQLNGADWRTHFLLASAYAKAERLSDAEPHAQRAVSLAGNKAAAPYLLLGEIQKAEGKVQDARRSWQELVDTFPADPAAQQAKMNLAILSATQRPALEMGLASMPVRSPASLELESPAEQPWAPPDIDSLEYLVAQNAPCLTDEVISSAEQRLRSQLRNFEKFTATEHIEHQEIDRYGRAGVSRSRDFSYIVFVYPFRGDSFYLQEERTARGQGDSFPTSLATTGLNGLGVAVLQPAERKNLEFRCEGLSNVRGRAAWQIRFEEKKGAQESIRDWRRDGKVYSVPIKGRIWIASTNYDLLRIETDLREPVPYLALTRDHLLVDYGPVRFRTADTSLWLPWRGEMYMEIHGHRYHHQHLLSDYMLFEVDTAHKVEKPKEAPRALPPSE
jgi:Flp pilus assembly protein TadD